MEMVRQHMVFKDTPNMRVAKLKRFMARPTFADELELHRVDCQSSHAMLDSRMYSCASIHARRWTPKTGCGKRPISCS